MPNIYDSYLMNPQALKNTTKQTTIKINLQILTRLSDIELKGTTNITSILLIHIQKCMELKYMEMHAMNTKINSQVQQNRSLKI